MRQSNQHVFAQIPSVGIERSSFDRSSGLKTTFDAGYLIPVFVDEVLPGDTFNLKMTGFCRLATPIFPLMDNAYLESFFFFVPYRLVWENWQRFMGERDPDPDSSIDYLVPSLWTDLFGSVSSGSLYDYFGLPITPAGLPAVSSLPFRAYYKIWNDWFRDQNLQDSLDFPLGDGPDVPGIGGYSLQRRGKRHDYFTSCLPWPQKGDAVTIPLAGSVDITGTGTPEFTAGTAVDQNLSVGPTTAVVLGAAPAAPTLMSWGSDTALIGDLSTATSAAINAIRQAFQIQRLLERDARGGTRYIEIILSHFGVRSPDARLQRPEYLGGGSSPLIISQVPQTSESATTPQGNLAAYGTVTARNHGFTQSFTEHGVVVGLVSVRADLTYQQGIERFWSRSTRYDFYWPAFAHLGEQAVLNKEIFVSSGAPDTEVFGYQERYAEYRYKPSRLTGLMRSDAPGSLDAWNLAQDFAALPVLDSDFIEEDPPFDRVIAVDTEPHFIGDFHFSLRCARPMPVYGVPGLIDHF